MAESPAAHGWKYDAEWRRQVVATAEQHPQVDETLKAALVFECWRRGPLAAIVAHEPLGGDLRWHVSLSHQDRVPNWEELSRAGHELRPGVVFCVGVPPRSWWININPHVLHLWELRDAALVTQWRFEGRGDEPS